VRKRKTETETEMGMYQLATDKALLLIVEVYHKELDVAVFK
jgi:hypothetical protein